MKTPLIFPRELLGERSQDFRYASHQSILLPAGSLFIGTQGSLIDAELFSAGDLTWSFANGTGDNGLDAGVEANSTWYALYAVPNAAGTAYMLKASTNPPHSAGGTGPTGYSRYRYLGVFRNGGNTWDATNGSYGQGDIVRFAKVDKRIDFHGFHTNNGGLSPSAVFGKGVVQYVANTSTNNTMIDVNNANYIGFTGNNPQGAAKLPYRRGLYGFQMVVNPGNSTSSMVLRDADGVNNRCVYGATTTANSQNFWTVLAHLQFSPDDFATVLRTEANNNANCSRILYLDSMVDPYII